MARRDRGFTMLEMMVVLAIMGIAMTMVPAVMSGLNGSNLRAASDDLVWRLRETRNEALRRGEATELMLDLTKRSYATTTEPGARPLPAVVDAVEIAPAALRQPDGIARIRFLADGTATQARITLRHGGSSGAVVIDWLTGGVRNDG